MSSSFPVRMTGERPGLPGRADRACYRHRWLTMPGRIGAVACLIAVWTGSAASRQQSRWRRPRPGARLGAMSRSETATDAGNIPVAGMTPPQPQAADGGQPGRRLQILGALAGIMALRCWPRT